MEGARWNQEEMHIDEAFIGQFYDRMPIILLIPCMKTAKSKNLYDAPVYRTAHRKNVSTKSGHLNSLITYFGFESRKPISHWIDRGVALLCELNE